MENKEIIFATSISPKHFYADRQTECVNSWAKYGKVVSMNHPSEIEELKDKYPQVTFIPTHETQFGIFGKHYPTINNFVNLSKKTGATVFLVNSDCELDCTQNDIDAIYSLVNSKKVFFFLHRHNFNEVKKQCSIYKNGIDLFVFTPELANEYPMTMYCLGHTFFDIWYPYYALTSNIPLYSIQTRPLLLHKDHPQQYNAASWSFFGKYTNFLIGERGYDAAQVSKFIYKHIWTNTKEL